MAWPSLPVSSASPRLRLWLFLHQGIEPSPWNECQRDQRETGGLRLPLSIDAVVVEPRFRTLASRVQSAYGQFSPSRGRAWSHQDVRPRLQLKSFSRSSRGGAASEPQTRVDPATRLTRSLSHSCAAAGLGNTGEQAKKRERRARPCFVRLTRLERFLHYRRSFRSSPAASQSEAVPWAEAIMRHGQQQVLNQLSQAFDSILPKPMRLSLASG